MKQVIILGLVLVLSGCGGYHSARREGHRAAPTSPATPASATASVTSVRVAPIAFGPISQACLASDRKARSRALCGCIQAVANDTLSGTDQQRAVAFYNDPHLAQMTRQSDRVRDERFWQAYKAYGERATQICR